MKKRNFFEVECTKGNEHWNEEEIYAAIPETDGIVVFREAESAIGSHGFIEAKPSDKYPEGYFEAQNVVFRLRDSVSDEILQISNDVQHMVLEKCVYPRLTASLWEAKRLADEIKTIIDEVTRES